MKQEEVVTRARNILPFHRNDWLWWQPGGQCYDKAKYLHGEEHAEAERKKADARFKAAAERAQTDLHGNPL